jgi:hypothetical protein
MRELCRRRCEETLIALFEIVSLVTSSYNRLCGYIFIFLPFESVSIRVNPWLRLFWAFCAFSRLIRFAFIRLHSRFFTLIKIFLPPNLPASGPLLSVLEETFGPEMIPDLLKALKNSDWQGGGRSGRARESGQAGRGLAARKRPISARGRIIDGKIMTRRADNRNEAADVQAAGGEGATGGASSCLRRATGVGGGEIAQGFDEQPGAGPGEAVYLRWDERADAGGAVCQS